MFPARYPDQGIRRGPTGKSGMVNDPLARKAEVTIQPEPALCGGMEGWRDEDMTKVLIVDDDDHIRKLYTLQLKRLGYETHGVSSGSEALGHLKANGRTDLVLLDYSMPQMDGLETFSYIRESWPQLPIIMVTALESTRLAVEFMHSGGDMFVVKPVNFDLLRMAIGEVLEKARLKRQYHEAHRALEVSEAYARAVFEASVNGIIIIGRDGVIHRFNPAAEEMFGYAAKEVVGKNVTILMPEHMRGEHQDRLSKYRSMCSGVMGREREVAGLRKCGKIFPLELYVSEVRIGGETLFLGNCTDITVRKEAESLNTRLGRIIEQSISEVYVFDVKTLRFITVNRGARENIGYTMEELKTLTPLDIKPEITRRKFMRLTKPLRDGRREELAFETVHKRKDGSTYDVEVRLQLMGFETPPVFVASIEDVTERKRAEEAHRESEARLHAVVENAPALIYIRDKEGRYVLTNKEFYRRHGTKPGSALGKTPHHLVSKEAADHFLAMDRRVLERGEALSLEMELNYADGVARTVLTNKFPVRGEDGHVFGVGVNSTDITARKKVERALQESEAKFRAIVEGETIIGTYILRRDGDGAFRFIYASPKFSEIAGCPQKQLEGGMDFIDLVDPGERSLVAMNLERRFAGGTDGATYSFSLVFGDGTRVPVQVHMGLTLLEGDPVIVGILRNMTAEQAAEERARRAEIARAAAEKATKAKSEFLANISHELRTPLTAVLGFAEQAVKRVDGVGTEELQRYLSRIVTNAYRLADVINDVLDLSKIEAGQEEFTMVRVDFGRLISDVAKDLWPLTKKRDLSVVVRSDLPPAQMVVCDAAQISRVVLNLVSNATKFANQGSTIEIRAWRNENAVYFSIADEGVEIPADERVKIFEPFTQSSLTDKGSGGTGLGLALCKRIIEVHGGEIWADMDGDHRVVFEFFLPFEGQEQQIAKEDGVNGREL